MSPLEAQFVADHRKLTRALSSLRAALEAADDQRAVQIADELDRLAGPHIHFEESILYLAVGRRQGVAYANRLLSEHRRPLAAVRFLTAHRGEPNFSRDERKRLIEYIRAGLEHAESCGRLLSHLTALDEPTQQAYLDELLNLRSAGERWTELTSPRAVAVNT